MIQGIFGTPGELRLHGRERLSDGLGQPDARFMDLREEEGALRQRVMIEDAEGRPWVLDYQMIELPEGWRINGVQVLPAPDLAA